MMQIPFSHANFSVVTGPPFQDVFVGGLPNYPSTSQEPASQNDAWETTDPILLRRGSYRMRITGHSNPFHGKLKLFLDRQNHHYEGVALSGPHPQWLEGSAGELTATIPLNSEHSSVLPDLDWCA